MPDRRADGRSVIRRAKGTGRMEERFDLIVIGGGPGGHAAAETAARLGARVCAIERDGWGGTCTHRGCIPTKALLACSGHYAALKRLGRLGIGIGEASFDFAAMKRHQGQLVRISALGVRKSLEAAGAVLKEGEGRLRAPGEVDCVTPDGRRETLHAKNVCLAWGSSPLLPAGFVPSARILTSDGLLALPNLPERIAIVGGSVIGVEFATLLAELGCRVTLWELLDRLIPTEDPDLGGFLAQELKRLGVEIRTGVRMTAIEEDEDGVALTAEPAERDGETPALQWRGTCVLLAAGRRPSLDEDALKRLGIDYGLQGIRVDTRQQTTVPGIQAVGDVTGGMMLAHRAMQQGRALADRLFGAGTISCDERAAAAVIYTHPPIARVGLTEQEAAARGIEIEIVRPDYAANIMARAELVPTGFAKLLFHRGTFAGAAVAGEAAGDLIAPLALAVSANLGRRELANWILPHPSLSELLNV